MLRLLLLEYFWWDLSGYLVTVSQVVIVIIVIRDDIIVILVLCFSVYRSLENLILSGMCAVLNLRVLLVLYLLYIAWAYGGC